MVTCFGFRATFLRHSWFTNFYKKVLYLKVPDRHWTRNPFDAEVENELMIPPLLEHSLIRIQTLREAPSGPHVQGLGKHVYLDKSPKDTHCWKELFVFTALETWKCQFDRHCYWPFYTEWLAELVDILFHSWSQWYRRSITFPKTILAPFISSKQ